MQQAKSALNQYKTVEMDAAVLAAAPHELITKLLNGAIDALRDAKRHIQNNDIPAKGLRIKLAISIIADGLKSSLNLEEGGEIAANLDALYDYMLRRLISAHAHNDTAIIDEIVSILAEIKTGWDGIRSEVMNMSEASSESAT